ncbi:MAG: hypothetical protein CBC42_05925 [Betaproteobacteria bacterium TMED82]|nr:MAG: hypothetical protein CBC42_05925 [Betaproteobacteria bacterium TMED82]
MKVLIDLQGAQASNAKRGIGRYSLALAESIFALELDWLEVHILLNFSLRETAADLRNHFHSKCPQDHIHGFFLPDKDSYSASFYAQASLIRNFVIDSVSPDVVLLTSFFEAPESGVVIDLQTNSKHLNAIVLYDLIPLLHQDIYLTNSKEKAWYLHKVKKIKEADLIMAISKYTESCTKRELLISADRLAFIGGGVDQKFFSRGYAGPSVARKNRKKNADTFMLQIKKNFLFCVSGIDPRKNLEFLIEGFSKLEESIRADLQLVITCKVDKSTTIILDKLLDKFSLSHSDVIFTGYVDELQLRQLYIDCYLFVFPSWEEGLGLPVLEAMSCGAPCIFSNVASLKEFEASELNTFDPLDISDLVKKISDVIEYPSKYLALVNLSSTIAKRYTWNAVAERAISSLKEKTLNRKVDFQKRDGEKNLSLAYLSPLPPDKSGIADYSFLLIKYLTKFYEITVILPRNSKEKSSFSDSNLHFLSEEKFKVRFDDFDRVLYHFGNSKFHINYLSLIQNYPGVAVLHDFSLDGVVSLLPEREKWLWVSHGISANYLKQNSTEKKIDVIFPQNLPIIDSSLGVILHSNHALNMMQKWYGDEGTFKCEVVPFLKEIPQKLEKKLALKKLNIGDEFIVAAFGYLGVSKMNLELIEAWSESQLAKKSILVFVGELVDSDLTKSLTTLINTLPEPNRVLITNWVDDQVYKAWFSVAEIAVQLRKNSRGETSAALLDCLANKLPTITNNHGDTLNLTSNEVYLLPENFSVKALGRALEHMFENEKFRAELAKNGLKHVSENNKPAVCSATYHSKIEKFYRNENLKPFRSIEKLKKKNLLPVTSVGQQGFVNALVKSNSDSVRRPSIFIDISELTQRDLRTGIQRVVRNILRNLVINFVTDRTFRIEPVFINPSMEKYEFAGEFISNFLELNERLENKQIEPKRGDIFLGLDLAPILIPKKKEILDELVLQGVNIQFVVYDIIPLVNPEFFPRGAHEQFKLWFRTVSNYQKLICISKSTEAEVRHWLKTFFPERLERLKIRNFKLGNSLLSDDLTHGYPRSAETILKIAKEKRLFIMVGTVEPRKGHQQVLDAFNLMWEKGEDPALLIIGKKGWNVDELVEQIESCKFFRKHLLWLKDCSDEFLLRLYAEATGLIAASYAEGYGLPVVESQNFGLSVFARDIPVFREINESFKNIHLFSASSAQRLQQSFIKWRNGLEISKSEKTRSIEPDCWENATKELQKIIFDNS